MLQAGIELIGAPAPEGTAEALTVLCRSLDAVGLKDYRIGVGDASLFPALMESLQVRMSPCAGPAARRSCGATSSSSSSACTRRASTARRPSCCSTCRSAAAAPELLTDAPAPAVEAVTGMRRVYELLDADVAERVIFDLGLIRNIGYYTGAVFEVYDPALGAPIGGGGRYDELLGRFGRQLPAVGFALDVDQLHQALAGEERGTGRCCSARLRATARAERCRERRRTA